MTIQCLGKEIGCSQEMTANCIGYSVLLLIVLEWIVSACLYALKINLLWYVCVIKWVSSLLYHSKYVTWSDKTGLIAHYKT